MTKKEKIKRWKKDYKVASRMYNKASAEFSILNSSFRLLKEQKESSDRIAEKRMAENVVLKDENTALKAAVNDFFLLSEKYQKTQDDFDEIVRLNIDIKKFYSRYKHLKSI